MTKRILAAILATVILLTLAGCANNKADAPAPDTTRPAVTATAETTGTAESDTDTEHTEEKKNGTAEETKPAETSKTQEPSESVTEPTTTETKPAETKPPQTEQPKTEETKPETKPTEPETPPKQTEEKPKETEPEVTEPPKATEPPAETQPTETTEPEPAPFDINHWIAYAKSYAESKGLVLSNTAVDCWDNPIRAGAHCIYLERDLQSRLNRYARDEDITDVWIWAEATGNDCYDIYIGYA